MAKSTGRRTRSKIDALNRLLYVMEENSVVALTKDDPEFRSFMIDLYSKVDHKITDLSKHARD